ncbi:DsbC family protein [Nitrosomonas ureae]|uniref:Thiol:disulfide interchange protein n=1 Tax=Nitrosomonas ureae TaxID=44577 RepID=A0A1H5RP73_9PROT|nr:DsbC family protein [Nitrosomonas ureae]SEF39327.1 thiol:disulfide interchange protein DsbC [Nitrosomonas ureae]
MATHLKFFILILSLSFSPGMLWADEEAVKKAVQPHFESQKIDSVKKTPFSDLYEVVVGDELFYTDDKADFFFFGHVINTKSRVSMTNERIQEIKAARRVPFDSLPLQHAIKAVKGDGKRKIAVYTDPNCPYCKQLEKELINITNVTVYNLLYPVLNGSMELSKKIWCSENQIKAWEDFMLKGTAPAEKDCEAPLETLVESGRENKVSGTPTLIFSDGSVVGGMIPAAAIEEKLENASKDK